MADCSARRRSPQRQHIPLLAELHHMPSWNPLLFMRSRKRILSPNKGWAIPWCLGEGGDGGGSHYETCFHSNPNIAAMKFEQR